MATTTSADSARRGLYTEARGWRSTITTERQASSSVKISRSSSFLDVLRNRMVALDNEIAQMVELGSGNISFRRSGYKYVPGTGHWIDAAKAPFVGFANGAAMPEYDNPGQELGTEIWDAGHYVDELANSLRERVLATAAIERHFARPASIGSSSATPRRRCGNSSNAGAALS